MTEGKVKTVLGKVALTPCGEYKEDHLYHALDVLRYQGNSYLVLSSFEGITPNEENPHVMLLAQKGEQGDAFTYKDFTAQQLESLRGEQGKGFRVLGCYETLLELEALITHPEAGDAYAVGEKAPYDMYIYDAAQQSWINHGPLEGPQGEPGTDGKSAYEIAVEYGFEGTEREWLIRQVVNGENLEEVTIQSPAITLESEEHISLQTQGKVLYNDEEVATKQDLKGLVTQEALQEKIDRLGAVTYIALITDDYTDIETLENLRPGAIILVKEEDPTDQNNYKEYIWLSEEAGWEYLGMISAQNFDIENYYDKGEIDEKFSQRVDLHSKQTIVGVKTFTDALYSTYGFRRTGYGGAAWGKGHGALNVEIGYNEQQTPLLVAHRAGTLPSVEGEDRLFSLELLNQENVLVLRFGGKTYLQIDLRSTPILKFNDKELATVDQTPQYGTYQTITGISQGIDLSKNIYDIRLSINGGNAADIAFITGGTEGKEYIVTLKTIYQTTYTLPTGEQYQSDSTTWTIPAGKVGQLSIRYIFGKYILKVL